jgi:hypothetical protein
VKTRAFVISLLIVASVACLWTSEARAADQSPKEQAVVKLVEGGELLKQGDYKSALVRFQEAFNLVPSPKIYYNFGLAYAGMGRNAAAIEAFDKFLAEATDAPPDRRLNADRQRTLLLAQVASLTVNCSTAGADLSVDGRSYGLTPRADPIRLDPGPHQLVVDKAGLAQYTQRIVLEAGTRTVVEARLSAQPSAEPPPPVVIVQPPPAAPAAPPPSPASPPNWGRRAAIGLAVLAVAGLAFGTVSQLGASGKYGDFNKTMPANQLGKCDSDPRVKEAGGDPCSQLLSDGDSAKTKALIGFIAGGALAAGAVTLFVLSNPKGEVQSTHVACAPQLGVSGVTCALRF